MSWVLAMRPKARRLVQHGGPPGWFEESDPAGRDFVLDGRSMPPSLTDYCNHRLNMDSLAETT